MQGETFKLNQKIECLQLCLAASEHRFINKRVSLK